MHSRPRPRDKRVVLASTSLRRRDILGSIGIDPEIVLFTFEENLSPGSFADTRVPGRMYEELVPNLAFGYGRNDTPTRSRACYAIPLGNPPIERNPRQPPDVVIVADTIVLTHPSPIASNNDQTQLGMEQQLLEKQGTKEENLRMLLDMNGNVCEVPTGATLIFPVLQSPGYDISSIDEGCGLQGEAGGGGWTSSLKSLSRPPPRAIDLLLAHLPNLYFLNHFD
ncbi:hypothetical protein FA13DRAFT_1791349 [Coprinellus micaceus]|uniref:Maf/Ham1 n=1 Tax=Coprinellus micaceus TaxID=71717 RepID=A0A4Y7TBK7_COPMI|nr:hypothetical protein FA13DRAFT_1791349 [Coprinellus micaceus]